MALVNCRHRHCRRRQSQLMLPHHRSTERFRRLLPLQPSTAARPNKTTASNRVVHWTERGGRHFYTHLPTANSITNCRQQRSACWAAAGRATAASYWRTTPTSRRPATVSCSRTTITTTTTRTPASSWARRARTRFGHISIL